MFRVLSFPLIAVTAVLVLVGPASASDDVPGFVEWPSGRLKEAADRLEQKIGKDRMVFETIGNWKGHSVYLVLRGATSDPEFHETEKDLHIVQRGKATFVIGGQLVDERKMPRKQRRGSSISGGLRRASSAPAISYISPSPRRMSY